MNRLQAPKIFQWVLALVAVAFGVATLLAGTRVLAGSDPGYLVLRPLLIFNTAMGLAYVAAGVIAWRDADRGTVAASAILVLNFLVLGVIVYLYRTGGAVAFESVGAMMLRTGVWFVLFLGLAWLSRTRDGRGRQPGMPPGNSARPAK